MVDKSIKTLTGPQVRDMPDQYTGKLPKRMPVTDWYNKVRAMRTDPTISLVRSLMVAPALLGSWSVETAEEAPEGAKELIEDTLFPLRTNIVRQSLQFCVDFGWAAFEKVFDRNDDGQIYLRRLKHLLPDLTEIIVDPATGDFRGFFQQSQSTGGDIIIELPECFLHSLDVEGTGWYGSSLMVNVNEAYDWWRDCNAANARFDKKIAGAHWVVHYPRGTSLYNGIETGNDVIANDILTSLQSSGMIAVPRELVQFIEQLNANQLEDAWKIELISASGSGQAGFTDRLKYIDSLKVRGLGFPERSVLEGQFGTKAEAEAHADFAIAIMEVRHEDLLRDINWHIVNQLLRLNYGEESDGTVYITKGPIADQNRSFLQKLYSAILTNPEGWIAEFDNIDRVALRDQLMVPTDEEAARLDEEDSDGIRDEGGSGDDLREGEREGVGGREQRREPDDDRGESDVVD